MWKVWKAMRKLWVIATCDHWNMTSNLSFDDSTELVFCRGCGRILHCTNEGERRHNPHLMFPKPDFTDSERRKAIADFESVHG